MRCKICNKRFEIKKNFNNLLRIERYYICDTCYNKYKISLDMFTLPLSSGKILFVYTLFDKDYKIDTTPFIKEISMIYRYCLKKYKDECIILTERFYLSDENLKNLSILSKLESKNIVLVTDYIIMSY